MDLIGKTSEKSLDDIVDKARDYALLHGFTMRPLGNSPDRVEFVPFTLLPSAFPRAYYNEARTVQPIVNKLMLRVSLDSEFLRSSLEAAASVDGFSRRLLELHAVAERDGRAQAVTLGLLRSDYMLDARPSELAASRLKQIEVNTIASGQGWLGTACSRLQRYVLDELGLLEDCAAGLPDNEPLDGLCRGMLEAWRVYGEPRAAVLFVIEESPRHVADQRYHEYRLRELEPRVRVLRLSLGQLGRRASLDSRGLLRVDGREVGLVYLRSGYAPEQYAGEAEWQARLLIERSAAVKCPTLGYQLAGTKKVQQALARPGCLETYLREDESQRLRRHFAGLYSVDEAAEDVVELALARPEDFVLKPQREGGSNNVFGDEVAEKLRQLRQSGEGAAWILMERVKPVSQKNYIVRPAGSDKAGLELCDVNSELGVFGVTLADGDRIIDNRVVGHTLRTKMAEFDEGGVSSGYGACDSPFLV